MDFFELLTTELAACSKLPSRDNHGKASHYIPSVQTGVTILPKIEVLRFQGVEARVQVGG